MSTDVYFVVDVVELFWVDVLAGVDGDFYCGVGVDAWCAVGCGVGVCGGEWWHGCAVGLCGWLPGLCDVGLYLC